MPVACPKICFKVQEQGTALITIASSSQDNLRLRWKGNRLDVNMEYGGNPIMTHGMVKEYRHLQTGFSESPEKAPHWMVVTSAHGQGFCYGGDAELLLRSVRSKNRETLHDYAHDCIDMLLANLCGHGADVITIGVVDGDAFGLGFEAAMSFDYLIATPRSRFAFPDTEFGLFPGMGAQMFLSRKIGMASASLMINEGTVMSAAEMKESGIVTHLAEDDDIEATIAMIIRRNESRRSAIIAARHAMARACPIGEEELRDIVDIWIDSTMKTSHENLERMEGRMSGKGENIIFG